MNTSKLLTIDNTNNSPDKVVGIQVEGNTLRYVTNTNNHGYVTLLDATGDYAAEVFISWVKETVTTNDSKESTLIKLVKQYCKLTHTTLHSFHFNGYL